MDRAMKVVVKDHNSRFGKRHDMGEFETTMQRFIDANNEGGDNDEAVAFTLRRGDKNVGNVSVMKASVLNEGGNREPSTTDSAKPRPEFVDYLTGGCQISLAVAIDFTASNGKFQAALCFLPYYPCTKLTRTERQSERGRHSALLLSTYLKQVERLSEGHICRRLNSRKI